MYVCARVRLNSVGRVVPACIIPKVDSDMLVCLCVCLSYSLLVWRFLVSMRVLWCFCTHKKTKNTTKKKQRKKNKNKTRMKYNKNRNKFNNINNKKKTHINNLNFTFNSIWLGLWGFWSHVVIILLNRPSHWDFPTSALKSLQNGRIAFVWTHLYND